MSRQSTPVPTATVETGPTGLVRVTVLREYVGSPPKGTTVTVTATPLLLTLARNGFIVLDPVRDGVW